jgi:hypothetical protein
MICTHCQTELTEGNSGPRARTRGKGLCHTCERKVAKRLRTQSPLTFIIYRTRGNAKIRGIEFNITEKDLPLIPDVCPVFPWIKLVYAIGEGRSAGSLSLDRIDSSKGYVRGNLRFVSDRANRMKSDMSDAELAALGTDAEKRIRAGFPPDYVEKS